MMKLTGARKEMETTWKGTRWDLGVEAEYMKDKILVGDEVELKG